MKYAHIDKNAGADNPLGDYPQQFRSHLEREHYSRERITQYVLGIDALSGFLRQSNVAIKDLDEDRAIKLLMQSDRSLHWKKKTVFIVQSFVRFLQGVGVARPMLTAPANDAARGRLRQEYEEYLRRQRGLSERTIFHSWRLADRFLEYRFGKEIGDLSQITSSKEIEKLVGAFAPRVDPAQKPLPADRKRNRNASKKRSERRTAADAPMYLRHRYWHRVGVPEAGIA